MEACLDDLKKHNIFGRYMGLCYRIKYQKRGLPHAHLLLFLHEDDHFLDPATIDQIISAEFPDKEADPELHHIITSAMVHGPCGDEDPESRCMAKAHDGVMRCSKRFPKSFCDETLMQANGFPIYRRRRGVGDGPTIRLPSNRDVEVTLDNQWVVPFNPYLSKKY